MPKPASPEIAVPSPHNWRTTDEDEINRRRARARSEDFRTSNTDPRHPIFSNFQVRSGSGLTYSVEVRDVRQRQFACECVDFRINGLGTCKHVEAVLLHLEARFKRLFRAAKQDGTTRLDVVPDPTADSIRLINGNGATSRSLKAWFDADGKLRKGLPEEAIEALKQFGATAAPGLRLSQELGPWLEARRRVEERKELRRDYELKVQSGQWPAHETKVPLFPYQREGMLHLAFAERALLADEMGLGKTIQAIAACALLHRLGRAARVLVVTPASLKTEWEEQIQRFTDLPYQLVFGNQARRLKAYEAAAGRGAGEPPGPLAGGTPALRPFFTIVNYEQMLADSLEVNHRLRPDIVVLDEAQRIKNWSTRTTQAVKRLRSRYAFILTGTPIENRIDELYSLMDFLNPSLLGPLFRFNREYYALDDRGRPAGYRNLDKLHERIKLHMLRRRKADVETELPERTDRNHFVSLSAEQQGEYEGHEGVVARLASIAKRRPLTQQEQDKLLRHLNMMRMVCDTNFILNPDQRACPKLAELEKILEECRDNPDVKAIVFSEWERMLELARGLCDRLKLGFAWHTGTVPQKRRRAEINAFKSDPRCRVFLSTDSGAAGLNLQNASVVVNCDLPWNPAKLEQRIARAWRKHQTRAVTVINLVSEKTIEHRMLGTLSNKQALADGVLDRRGNLQEIKLQTGRQAFLAKLQQLVAAPPHEAKPETREAKPPLPADRPRGFAAAARQHINGALLRCEERYPNDAPHSVLYVVVERDAAQYREQLNSLHAEYFGPGQWDPLAPVRLEVIDRATDEALQRLIDAGLLARTTRANRPLWPAESAEVSPPPLSTAELEKLSAHRHRAGRKLKMARVLCDAGLIEEARAALLEAVPPLGCALAVQHRFPEPASPEHALLPPLSSCWKEALPLLREFTSDAARPCPPVLEALLPLAEYPSSNACRP
ncbi:MAG TPA: DEAD/DEAH box helicase [Candidatus Paceibacterota bacterium]|nr:DEAD/DEAH box helicase [Verrucomicrobiota bacterium]HSA09776.1 DEAD/DEAH box helicase [Candidatus Paceibacterota bacterium]